MEVPLLIFWHRLRLTSPHVQISITCTTLMVLIFAGTNFRGNFFFEKSCILRVLIFADGSFENFSQVLIFTNRQKLTTYFNPPKSKN